MIDIETHKTNYQEHLLDKRWQRLRIRVLERDGHKCRICGSEDHLVVHHKQYHITPDGKKLLPWMYDEKYLVTLCKSCHSRGHNSYKVPVKVLSC